MFIYYILSAFGGALLALAIYLVTRRIIMKGRRDEIIEKAELEAENIKKEKILQAKEKFLQLKSEHEKYVNQKNAEIKELNDLVVSQKETILDLKNNIVNKDNLVALQREIDSKNVTIREKDFEIKMLKDKSVSREEFSRIQDELDKKEEQIQRLNEVKDLFFEISGTEASLYYFGFGCKESGTERLCKEPSLWKCL